MSAIFAFSMVPTGAWAESGRVTDSNSGKITLLNAEDGETYSIYRIFTLLSFDDTNNNAGSGNHSTDKYSYGLLSTSKWANFFDAEHKPEGNSVVWGSDYFVIDKNHPITVEVTNAGTYYPVSIKDGGLFDSENPNVANQVTPVTDETSRVLSIASAAAVQPFARAALEYASNDSNGVSADGSKVADSNNATTTNADDNKVKVEFEDLTLGYYLVSSTLGSFVALDTTNKEVTVLDKNETPTIEKKVKNRANANVNRDGSTGKYTNDPTVWVDDANYDIGDTITFRTKITVPKGARTYKLHDVMEAGFTLEPGAENANFEVWASKDSGSADKLMKESTANESTYVITTNPTDGCDFEIEFKDAWLDALVYDSSNQATIEVEYKAMLNKDAVVKGDDETNNANFPKGANTAIVTNDSGPADPQVPQITRDHVVTSAGGNPVTLTADNKNTNSALLTFGENSSTVWADATVECFDFDLVKTGGATATGGHVFNLLDNAKFELYRDSYGSRASSPIGMVLTSTDTTVAVTGIIDAQIYSVPDSTQASLVNEFTTSKTQKISFRGLEAGTYWLHETVAPHGYNQLSGDIKIVVGEDGNITYTMGGAGESGHLVSANAAITYNATQSTYTDDAQGQGGVQVVNLTGPELPSTGGIGTTNFYVVGGALVAVAAVVTKRRMGTEA